MPYQEPDFLPWDGRRVPMTLLGGYLGAGKTTLLNALLESSDRPIAVLVNDVGEVNIDARLIKKRSGDTIELTDGCVCCSLVDGFGAAFDQIRARERPPDHLIVELSGLADPNRVRPWGNTSGFLLDGVVTLVDVEVAHILIEDPTFGLAYRTQIEGADLLVGTKVDLVDARQVDRVRTILEAIAPGTPFVTRSEALTNAAFVALGGRRPNGIVDLEAPTLFDAHRTEIVPMSDPITPEELRRLVETLPSSVVRAKGIARHDDGSSSLVQVVGRRREISRLPAAESTEPTPLIVITVP